jgi:endoglucanase
MSMVLQEITMAAPDVIRIEIRDPKIVRGRYQQIAPQHSAGGPAVSIPEFGGNYGWVIGWDDDWAKESDSGPDRYLYRPNIRTAAQWNTANPSGIGGRTITGVYRNHEAYDYGQGFRAGVGDHKNISMVHYIYLKLSSNLTAGTYTINWPVNAVRSKAGGTYALSNELASTPIVFVFNDKVTRCSSIKSTAVGHHPNDVLKLAYLCCRLTEGPNEGAVNFMAGGYGLTQFQLLNSNKEPLYYGSIALRLGATEVDAGSGYVELSHPTEANWYSGWTTRPDGVALASQTTKWRITAANNNATCTFTTDNATGLTEGMRVRAYSPSWYQLHNASQYYIVRNLSGLTFNLEYHNGPSDPLNGTLANSSTWPVFQAVKGYGEYSGHSFIAALHETNLVGTNVYGLDYSSFDDDNGTESIYYLHIPGMGISDPFHIDYTAHYRTARNAAAGNYHQWNGCEVDGRFGYTRPATFRQGVNNVNITRSKLPKLWTNYDGGLSNYGAIPVSSRVQITRVHDAPWDTGVSIPSNAFGGYKDAGDWDDSIGSSPSHLPGPYSMLDVWEMLPEAGRAQDFGIPKVHEMRGNSFYAGTDGIGDLIHAALWYADFYRTTQKPNGSIVSGLTYGEKNAANTGIADQAWCWPEVGTSWHPAKSGGKDIGISTYGEDHIATLEYCGLAGKISAIFTKLGFTAAATVWRDSAQAAWDWANPIQVDDAGQFDAFYNPLMDLVTGPSWTTQQRADVKNVMKTYHGVLAREHAAIGMFRCTGNTAYETIALARYYPVNTVDFGGEGGWVPQEYLLSDGANTAAKDYFRTLWIEAAEVFPLIRSEADCSFRRIRRGLMHIWGGQGFWTIFEGTALIRGWYHSSDPTFKNRCLAAVQAGVNWLDGANFNGFAYTTGIGPRNVQCTLDVDHKNGPPLAQQPIGKTIYGHGHVGSTPGGGLQFQFGAGSSLVAIVEYPLTDLDATWPDEQREWYPWRNSQGPLEFLPQNWWAISMNEYTVTQTIDGKFVMTAFLQGHDGLGIAPDDPPVAPKPSYIRSPYRRRGGLV